MDIRRASRETCAQADGTVVVIDVLRAFSTAAYAFAAGVQDITLVGTVEEAFALRAQRPGALIMGEVHGLPVEGFDFGNSPAALAGLDLSRRRFIQRTSAGTQGVVRSVKADHLLTASFCCATATARYVRRLAPAKLTFVITGLHPDEPGQGWGDEDAACADYLEALVRGQNPEVGPFIQRVRRSAEGIMFANPSSADSLRADLECCVAVDRFDFAMVVSRQAGLLVMEKTL